MSEIDPRFCFTCRVCGKKEEMVWGDGRELCLGCIGREFIPGTAPRANVEYSMLLDIAEYYGNPDNWRRFPVEEGVDANGSPVVQYIWIGDGGEFARKILG